MGNSKVKLTIERPVTVITPTIGKPDLIDAMKSVEKQTYNCKHLIVIDGPEYSQKAMELISNSGLKGNHTVYCSPENTGANGYYGHRIYAAFPHLVNSDYILFLDEDNWYEPNHVETLIETIEQKGLHFSYSLRKIFDKNKNYLIDDNCESLGKWEIFMSRTSPHGKQYLIDTSSYCFKREFIQQVCHLWHSGWGGDRRFFHIVKDQSKYDTNGLYSLCYRLDGNEGSVTKEFFESGNKTQEQYFGGNYPWNKKT